MDDWNGEIDVGHPLAPHFGKSHLDAAAIADDSLVLDFLIFSAGAFPVASRSEDLLAKKAPFFRFEGALIDCFGFFDLAPGPLIADHFIRCDLDRQLIELRSPYIFISIKHLSISPKTFRAQAGARFSLLYKLCADVEAKPLHLFHKYIKRLGRSRNERIFSLHDRLVNAGPSRYVI